MELGQYQMQIALSVVVILGAAFVALICDLLKRNNEQLRELAIELKVRREEENKRFQTLAPQALGAPNSLAPATAIGPGLAGQAPEKSARQHIAEPVTPMPSLAASAAKRPGREKRALSPEALAAIQRGEQLAASPRQGRAPDRVPAERTAAGYVADERFAAPQDQPEVKIPVVEVIPPSAAPVVGAKSNGASRDWGSLLNARRRPAPPSALSEAILPAGFQDGFVLKRLVEARQPVSGLVVSIGAGNQDTNLGQDANRSLPANVRGLIQSLIGPNDFAAQSGKEEFLLIYPGERGAAAQRRLGLIAEQLWDFQLRSLGTLSIQFSWGGVEVRSESIEEAIASATERMQDTRRGRRVLTMEPRADAPLRRAV